MAQTPTILLTRPAAASHRFAQQLRGAVDREVDILISPLIEIAFHSLCETDVKGRTAVFTSMNGVESWRLSNLPTRGPAYCVGSATAEAATSIGFDSIDCGGDLERMIGVLLTAREDAPFVHIHGQQTRGDLVGALRRANIPATGVVAYDQNLCALSDQAKRRLNGQAPVIVPLFSPRSAAQFAAECPDGANAKYIAISDAAAKHLPNAQIAAQPDAESMIAAICQCL